MACGKLAAVEVGLVMVGGMLTAAEGKSFAASEQTVEEQKTNRSKEWRPHSRHSGGRQL
jgi:hypothetical protein